MLKSEVFQSTAKFDARLVELEQDKKKLLAPRKQLQHHAPNSSDSALFSPEKKLRSLGGCLEAEPISLLIASKINKISQRLLCRLYA